MRTIPQYWILLLPIKTWFLAAIIFKKRTWIEYEMRTSIALSNELSLFFFQWSQLNVYFSHQRGRRNNQGITHLRSIKILKSNPDSTRHKEIFSTEYIVASPILVICSHLNVETEFQFSFFSIHWVNSQFLFCGVQMEDNFPLNTYSRGDINN